MRSPNARAHDALESAWLADVKRIPCVTCNKPPPNEADHREQGRHFCTIGWCDECHRGPDGWMGMRSRQALAKQTWLDCLNETIRRVVMLRAGIPLHLTLDPLRVRQRGGDLSSSKVIRERRY